MNVAFKEKQQYIPDIFNSSFDSIIILSPEGIIEHINEASLRILGGHEDEYIGHPISVILAEIGSMEEDIYENVDLDTLILRGLLKFSRLTFNSKNGKKVPMLLTTSLLKEDEKITGILCIAKDITPLVEADYLLKKEQEEANSRIIKLKEFADIIIKSISDILIVLDINVFFRLNIK